MPDSLLMERTVVLAKLETTPNVDSIPTPVADALLCANVEVSVDPNVLERNNYNGSLSNEAFRIGRKLVNVNLTHELKASGIFGVAPKIGRLLRACAMSQTSVAATASAMISDIVPGPANTGSPVVISAKTTAPDAIFSKYRISMTTGGASATCEYILTTRGYFDKDTTLMESLDFSTLITSDAGVCTVTVGDYSNPEFLFSGTWAVDDIIEVFVGGVRFWYQVPTGGTATTAIATAIAALIVADSRFAGTAAATSTITVDYAAGVGPQVLTTADTIILGLSNAEIDVTIAGSAVAGDVFDIQLNRAGLHYDPVSDDFESITLYVYFDGILHKVTGCQGTWNCTGEAGNYASVTFNFTGQYHDPIEAPLPTSTLVYETSDPEQVELAEFALGDLSVCAQSFNIDINNTTSPRICINGSDGFEGVRVTGRQPQGGVNPEATLPSDFATWRRMSRGAQLPFHVRVGTIAGNIVHITADAAQISASPYGEREGDRVFEMSLRFARVSPAGNDEIKLVFQ